MEKEHPAWEAAFSGDRPDPAVWNIRYGNWQTDASGALVCPGWGNDEQQYYTGEPENLFVREGRLHLRAVRRESPEQCGRRWAYTSARIDTKGKFSFCYGRLAVRAKLPAGAGLWPAVWLMPEESAYGPWAASGEIDLVEAKGRLPGRVYGTLHYGGAAPNKTHAEAEYPLPGGGRIDDFHEYQLDWRPGALTWAVDGVPYAERREWPCLDGSSAYPAPFDRPFYLLVNLAVGGWYDPVPVDEAALPAELVVDSIRLYQTK